MALLVIDSGTTNTRIRRLNGKTVEEEIRIPAGARDGSEALAAGLRKGVASMDTSDVPYALLSGMITSPTGLYEVPHQPGPADLSAWAEHIVWRDFPDIWDRPMGFVPGVKFQDDDPVKCDVIRGEETELIGLMSLNSVSDFTALHLGSHHKVMTVRNGWLTESATAIIGEMISAVAGQTILKTMLSLDRHIPCMDVAEKACETALETGTSRALFLTRVMGLNGADRDTLNSWYLGAMASEDIRMLQPSLTQCSGLLIYGQYDFGRLLMSMISRQPGFDGQIRVLTDEESDQLATEGARVLSEQIGRQIL